MLFEKGDIIHFNFKEHFPEQYTIKGPHFAVVLQDSPSAQTIMVAPISSLYDDSGTKKQLKTWHFELDNNEKYNLTKPCYIKTDQIHSINKNNIQLCENKNPLDIEECKELDMKLIEVFEMFHAFEYYAQKRYNQIYEIFLQNNKEEMFDVLRSKVHNNIFTPFQQDFKSIVKELIVEEDIKDKLNEYLEDQKDKLSKKILNVATEFTGDIMK